MRAQGGTCSKSLLYTLCTSGIRVRDPVTRIIRLLKISPGFQLNCIEHTAGNNDRIQPRVPGLALMATLNLRRRVSAIHPSPPCFVLRIILSLRMPADAAFLETMAKLFLSRATRHELFSTSEISWIETCCFSFHELSRATTRENSQKFSLERQSLSLSLALWVETISKSPTVESNLSCTELSCYLSFFFFFFVHSGIIDELYTFDSI